MVAPTGQFRSAERAALGTEHEAPDTKHVALGKKCAVLGTGCSGLRAGTECSERGRFLPKEPALNLAAGQSWPPWRPLLFKGRAAPGLDDIFGRRDVSAKVVAFSYHRRERRAFLRAKRKVA